MPTPCLAPQAWGVRFGPRGRTLPASYLSPLAAKGVLAMNDHRRDPRREELRGSVRAYLSSLRALGREPNRVVRFEGVTLSAWLIDDPSPHALARRYLLLNDGDAWCETVYGVEVPGGLSNTYEWLPELSAGLQYALECSLNDAHAGGDGFLVQHQSDEAIYLVADRRARPRRAGGDAGAGTTADSGTPADPGAPARTH